jgi:hypothetical protein
VTHHPGDRGGAGSRPADPGRHAAGEQALHYGHPMQARADRRTYQQRSGDRRQRQRPRRVFAIGRRSGQRVRGGPEPGRIGRFTGVIAVDLPPGERGTGQQAAPGRQQPQPRPAATHGRVGRLHAGQHRSSQPGPRRPPTGRSQRRPAHQLTRPRCQQALRDGASRRDAGADGRLGRVASHPAGRRPVIADKPPGKGRTGRLRGHYEPVVGGGDDPGRQRLIQGRPREQTWAEARADHSGRRQCRCPLYGVCARQRTPGPPGGSVEIHPFPSPTRLPPLAPTRPLRKRPRQAPGPAGPALMMPAGSMP